VPLLARIRTAAFTLDWEASEADWFDPREVGKLDLLPGTLDVIGQFFPEALNLTSKTDDSAL
jgi:hypothetical protein